MANLSVHTKVDIWLLSVPGLQCSERYGATTNVTASNTGHRLKESILPAMAPAAIKMATSGSWAASTMLSMLVGTVWELRKWRAHLYRMKPLPKRRVWG